MVSKSWNGTFLHTRRYLSHQGGRFKDLSLLVEDCKENLVGVFAAAQDPQDTGKVISHPGLTYGGLVHAGRLQGQEMLAAMDAISGHYASAGYSCLLYKAVPYFYHRFPSQDDSYAIFRLGGQRECCELSAVIDLNNRSTLSLRRTRNHAKAIKAGLKIEESNRMLSGFWGMLKKTLELRYRAKPVHSLKEISRLMGLFPENILCLVAVDDHGVLAGAMLYLTVKVTRVQYMASSEEGRKCGALDLVIERAITLAGDRGCQYLDLGTSNQEQGRVLNQGLYQFKSEFGGGGAVFEHYQIPLGACR